MLKKFLALIPIILLSSCAYMPAIPHKLSPEEEAALKIRMEQEQAAIRKQQETAAEARRKLVADCDAITWSRTDAFKKQTCTNQIELEDAQAGLGSLQIDGVKKLHMDNLEAALNFTEGKISKERFELTKQQNQRAAEAATAESLRILQVQQAEAAAQQAQLDQLERIRKAQAWQNLSNQLRQQQAIQQQSSYQQQMMMQMNRPVNTNCNRFGNSVNCTTW